MKPIEPSDYPRYRLEIAPSGQTRPYWSTEEIRRNSDGTFFLWLPGSYLTPGTCQLSLFGLDGQSSTLLDTYTVRAP